MGCFDHSLTTARGTPVKVGEANIAIVVRGNELLCGHRYIVHRAIEIVEKRRFVWHADIEKSPGGEVGPGNRLMPCIGINDREAQTENLAAVECIDRK